MRVWATMLALALLPSGAYANDCDSEVRSVENQARASGSSDLTTPYRINRAQTLCRDSPLAGRAELDAIRRQLDQEAMRPEQRYGQPAPLGQPRPGVGPGGAVN